MAGERPDRSAIETEQWRQLQSLLEAQREGNRFYLRKFEEAGLAIDEIGSLEDFLRRVPFTEKRELLEDHRTHPPFGSNLAFPVDRYSRFHQTSGTTSGDPMPWLDTTESWQWMIDGWKEVFRAAGVTAKDRVFFAFSFGPFIGFWLAFEAAAQLECLCVPGGGLGSAARLRTMLSSEVTVLCCTPTYAIRLGEVAAAEGIDLGQGRVKTLIVAGEPGASIPATRKRIENLWPGARPFDHHGMTEVGPVTYQCPERPGVLHIMETGYYPEIIDPATDRATAPGETGELVLTTLGRTGSPLLRYRTGDVVKRPASSECVCGRMELALEGGILGRTDDMVVVRGVNVYPSAVEEIIQACRGVAEYQVRVAEKNAMTELALTIEPLDGEQDVEALVAKLQSALQTTLSLRIPVTVAAPGSLPRFEMKARRWVRNP